MKNIFIATIILLLHNNLYSQQGGGTLSGKVYEAQTQKALDGANILLRGTKIGTTTNAQGEYRLQNIPAGTYIVEVSSLGYDKQQQQITVKNNSSLQLNFSLKEEAISLEEVSVTGKSKLRKLREQAAPITVISMKQLSGTVNSIADVLNKTVGVTIRSSGGVGSASRLSVRGLEGKRIGFFIDEIPLTDQSDFIDINDIPIDMIDRIEIYKGIVPAKFGGSAMGGAVNIVIKEYPEQYGDFSYSLGSFNTHKAQAVVKRNLKDQGLVFGVGGGYTYSDNNYTMNSPYVKGLKIKRDHDTFKKWLLGGSIKAKKWWFDEVEFEPIFLSTYREIQGIESDIRQANVHSKAYILGNNLKKDDFLTPGLDLDVSTGVAYTQYGLVDTAQHIYDWDGTAYPTPSVYGGELNRFPSDSDNKKLSLMNKINMEYFISTQHSLSFNSFFTLANGTPKDELRKQGLGYETLFNSKMRSWISGITYDFRTPKDRFLNAFTFRYYLYTMRTQNFDVYGSSKVEDIHLNKSNFGISNAMRYRFLPNLMGKFSIGREVRIPSETELLGDGYSISPSEQLLPEKNTNVNVGLLYDLYGKSQDNLQIELNGFYMHVTDMIRYTKGILGAQYQNFGEMRTLGVELEAKGDIFPFLYGYFNTTYQDLRDIREYDQDSRIPNPTKGKRIPNIPYFLANAGLEFHQSNLFGGKGQNTRIFLDASFVEQYYYDFELTRREKRRIPRTITADIGLEHSFMDKRLFLSAKVKNLTNAEVLSEFNRPLPGRSFGIKLRYVFSSDKN